MKKFTTPAIIVLMMAFSSCSAVAGIFKAGAAVGVIVVIVVIAIIICLFRGKSI